MKQTVGPTGIQTREGPMLNPEVASWKRWDVSWSKIWKGGRKERHSGKGGVGAGDSGQCGSKGAETGNNINERLKEELEAQNKNAQCLPYIGHCAGNKQ